MNHCPDLRESTDDVASRGRTAKDAPKRASVGDGGASWLRRAFKRAEEQGRRSILGIFQSDHR